MLSSGYKVFMYRGFFCTLVCTLMGFGIPYRLPNLFRENLESQILRDNSSDKHWVLSFGVPEIQEEEKESQATTNSENDTLPNKSVTSETVDTARETKNIKSLLRSDPVISEPIHLAPPAVPQVSPKPQALERTPNTKTSAPLQARPQINPASSPISSPAKVEKIIPENIKEKFKLISEWFKNNGGCTVKLIVSSAQKKYVFLTNEDEIKSKLDYDIFRKEKNGKSKFELLWDHLQNNFEGFEKSEGAKILDMKYAEFVAKKCQESAKAKTELSFFFLNNFKMLQTPLFKSSLWNISNNNSTVNYFQNKNTKTQ